MKFIDRKASSGITIAIYASIIDFYHLIPINNFILDLPAGTRFACDFGLLLTEKTPGRSCLYTQKITALVK
jgi:hypothetical protein